jgi:hypothetical protein
MRKFKIRRSFAPHLDRPTEDIEGMGGLTEEEAQEHCGSTSGHSPGEWFDLYVAE